MSRIAGPPYRTSEQWHGPCYVFDPVDWEAGWREVVAVLPPIPRRAPRRAKIYAAARSVLTRAVRRVVSWPKGRPLDWRLVDELVVRPAPAWHAQARALRARGLSIRAVMRELGIKSQNAMQRVLDE